MHYSAIVLLAALAAQTTAHGVVTEIQGANGVNMPGLSVIDGTPRDSPSPASGAEDDTSIIRDRELGGERASALGRTKGAGPVDAAAAIATFMGNGNGNNAAAAAAARSTSSKSSSKPRRRRHRRGLLSNLLGGGNSNSNSNGNAATTSDGTKTLDGASEQGVSKAAGAGANSGLPTCADDGTIAVTYHQVNQDGAGPLAADVDATSGGTDPAAFEPAQVTQDVPGFALGLSGTTTTDFPVKVQMPQGMTCAGEVAGVKNVCVARIRNDTPAGPFGGSVAFTQSAAAKKRAVEYNLRKRHFARGILGKL
ncbi:cell surface protein [Diplodia corticola]|uniref:Cell surface protein n=1 Tax=Diplodia corticola TaxID=236234 RepID=A0A1J9RL12_9PEZI|nr:cell surface protein [Diplodia corticola]OJD33267.1 cell surface protein [Diplodia corticola]